MDHLVVASLHVQRNCLAGGADRAMQRDATHCLQMVFSLGTECKSGFLNVKEAKDVVHLYFLSTCCSSLIPLMANDVNITVV